MLINTFLDTEDFVHLYYPEDEPAAAHGCGAGARMASKYPPRPPSPDYKEVATASSEMSDRERCRAPPPPEPPPHRVRAADLYPRLRTHYDEPGLDAGFQPICGEFVQWVGRTADGGSIAMSNYRVHLQPRRRAGPGSSVPLRLIDALEIRDLLCLIILCKHGRQLKCSFNTSEQCLEWWRRLSTALAPITSLQEMFAAAYAAWAKEQPPSSVHRALMRASQAPQRHWFGPELERLGFSPKGPWRVSAANAEYKLCPSYPPLLIVPASIGDEQLEAVARFRILRRVPAVVWRHRGTGAVIARSSQPEVGWFGWRSSEDEGLLAAFVSACRADRAAPSASAAPAKQQKLLIVDARSFASAVTNRARGGGCECAQYYPLADIQFMSLPNIHNVRKSFQQMRDLVAEPDQPNWHSALERTLWLQYVAALARAAGDVARAVAAGRPVLVHCSDGWDRTPQLVAAAQLLLDPHYRTLQGFRVLIEREWLDFGHKFAERCGHQVGGDDPNERSPIFLQWLHLVYQLMVQFPCAFEFNEAYLIKLATHVHSCMFGTFVCNSQRERALAPPPGGPAPAPQVWPLLAAPAYRNHLYVCDQEELWPDCSVSAMQVWWGLMGGAGASGPPAAPPAPAARPAPPLPLNGLLSKTRSCDNLLGEAEGEAGAPGGRRGAQRRSSDPSLAPDLIKLLVMNGKTGEERVGVESETVLSDSCVDALPPVTVPATAPVTASVTAPDLDDHSDHIERTDHNDHTDPEEAELHSEHFVGQSPGPLDITSTSSSLERELAAVAPIKADTGALLNGVVRDVALAGLPALLGPPATSGLPGLVGADVTDCGSPDDTEDRNVFDCDLYSDVIEMADTSREARTRNISITWRSISESSNQSSTGFDIPENSPQSRLEAPAARLGLAGARGGSSGRDTSLDSGDSSDTDTPGAADRNVLNGHTNHNRQHGGSNGNVHGITDVTAKFLEVELNGGVTSSGASSESDGERGGAEARAGGETGGAGSRVPSQLTLCPASPRRSLYCHCATDSILSGACWCGACAGASAVADAGAGAGEAAGHARCVCGAGAGGGVGAAAGVRADGGAADGLPPADDPLQARLHQIILYQKKVVEELSGQLRAAREALRRASPPAPHASHGPHAPHAAPPGSHEPAPPEPLRSGGGSSGSSSGGSGSSSSGSASEVEVGEEARGVLWLPDSAAPRCQHCRNQFWLARRRHHCRRCGGIFCGSCSEMSSWGEVGAVRVCRRCRALR